MFFHKRSRADPLLHAVLHTLGAWLFLRFRKDVEDATRQLGMTMELKILSKVTFTLTTTPCRFPSQAGQARVSASWLACTLTLDRWFPKWTPFTLFWAPSCASALSYPCGSDGQILKRA